MLALRPLRGLVVIDEIQKRPDLFPTLRVLVDEPRVSRRFLVLGSASPELLQQTSETLAGRIAYHELDGFSVEEAGSATWERLWARGGFPRSFLARSFGVAHTTVQRHLDVLSETLMVRQLPSWHENVGKRQVKAPKGTPPECCVRPPRSLSWFSDDVGISRSRAGVRDGGLEVLRRVPTGREGLSWSSADVGWPWRRRRTKPRSAGWRGTRALCAQDPCQRLWRGAVSPVR